MSESAVSNVSKRKCKFSDHMKTKCPCFGDGCNENKAKCLVCDSYVSVANKGSTDLERHVASEKHRNIVRTSASSAKVTAFFQPKHSPESVKARAAEATLAFHTVTHHQSYKSMDCTGLMRKLFADSQIANSITCARTKTEAIINNVIGPHTVAEVVKSLNDISCIGIATDASNHGA